MSGPLVRLIVQVVVIGANVAAKAFATAYQQAAAGGGAQKAAKTVSTTLRRKVPSAEAKQILNLSDTQITEKKVIEERFMAMFKKNDVEKGGSFYIQSKIVRAKESLEDDILEAEKKEGANEEDTEPKGDDTA